MIQAPEWWYQVSATYFVFGILFYLVLIGLLVIIIGLVKKLSKSIEELNVKVQGVSSRVETLVDEVKIISSGVGSQATEIVGNVNVLSRGLMGRVETASAIFTVLGAVMSFMKARKR